MLKQQLESTQMQIKHIMDDNLLANTQPSEVAPPATFKKQEDSSMQIE